MLTPDSTMENLKPVDAVAALYSGEHHELSESIVASLSHAIFSAGDIRPAGRLQRAFARVSYRLLQWTTRCPKSENLAGERAVFRNRILERCSHPFAKSLLASTQCENATLIEGGDPMNANYMMIAPEIRKNGGIWDRLFLDSVQGKDVRLRLAWETRATYEEAKRRLEQKQPVRIKGVAAGTGLSIILAYDKLVRDGYNPDLITAVITDREAANMVKTNRLLDKLATTKGRKSSTQSGPGILAATEDIFVGPTEAGGSPAILFDVVTAIGILEYFQGHSYGTTEKRLKMDQPETSSTALDVARRLDEMTSDRASLIVNTYRDDAATRILELFGRKFVYRSRENLRVLLSAVNFHPARLVGSGNIYDVKVYEKNLLPAQAADSATRPVMAPPA